MTAEQKPRVLYVDDLPLNLKLFEATFRNDYDITITDVPGDVMRLIEEKEIQVVVSDQRMPDMNGTDLLERIAEVHPDIRRFLLTAFTDTETVIEAVNKGRIHGYIKKPLQADEIRSSIAASLEVYHLRNRNRIMMKELEKANAALLNLDGLKSEIINSISKEISSPLNRIMGTLHLLKTKIEGDELTEVVNLLDRSVFKLEQFSLLAKQISLLKSPGFELKKNNVSLKQVVQFGVIETAEELSEQQIRMERILDGDDLDVQGDSGLLVSCLVALVRYAYEHTEEGGTVTVSATRTGNELLCQVSDQGANYQQEDFALLENRFSRKEESLNMDLGIGLALSRMIMESHGGFLTFRKGENDTGCFQMHFPPETLDD
ncbi:MAG: hybrid sensor histidine kinase/response regulator [Bacteroidales bacterium]